MSLVFEFTAPSQPSFVCLPPSICISPFVYHSLYICLSLSLLQYLILCLFLPFSLSVFFPQRKNTPHPSGGGCLLSILMFFILSSTVPRRTETQNVNIWTAAKDSRRLAQLPSPSWQLGCDEQTRDLLRPKQCKMNPTMSINDRERNCFYHFDVCYMATRLEMTAKMAACLNSACLINISPQII